MMRGAKNTPELGDCLGASGSSIIPRADLLWHPTRTFLIVAGAGEARGWRGAGEGGRKNPERKTNLTKIKTSEPVKMSGVHRRNAEEPSGESEGAPRASSSQGHRIIFPGILFGGKVANKLR